MHGTCTVCGIGHPSTDLHPYNGGQLCPDCLSAQTVICADCGRRISREENAGSGGRPLCPDCYFRSYYTCSRCGRIIYMSDAYFRPGDEEEDEPLCCDCYSLCAHAINDYYFKPEPIFYGKGPRFFGVELEIDGGGERADYAEALLRTANTDRERIYIKHDGSLDDGLEIVTHPMTLDYHLTQMPWQAVMDEAVRLGYTSHQGGTCGLHAHVNRSAFGATEAEQDQCIARVLYFFERYWEELLKFSRRTQRQLDRWAARYGYKDRPMDILDHAKKGDGAGRYSAVNLQNRDTVEFRMFRGTLKYNTLAATLQMLDRICDVALFLSDDELKDMSWTTFMTGCQTPELVQYLKERRLYVNEPVEGAVEL